MGVILSLVAGILILVAGCATTQSPGSASGSAALDITVMLEAGNPRSPVDAAMLAAFAMSAPDPKAPERSARQALRKIDRALTLDSKSASMHLMRGALYIPLGRLDEGLRDVNAATRLAPAIPDRSFSPRAIKESPATKRDLQGLLAHGRHDRFPGDFVNPDSPSDAGIVQFARRRSFAVWDWTGVIKRDPESSFAYLMRAVSAFKQGLTDQGLYDIERHLRYSRMDSNRFTALLMPWARQALVQDPKAAALLHGVALSAKDDDRAAIQILSALIGAYPEFAPARGELAWILATSPDPKLRDGRKALDLASQAVAKDPSGRNTRALAAAHAELGDFKQAVATQRRAVELVRSEGGEREDYSVYLGAYEIGLPWRKNQ